MAANWSSGSASAPQDVSEAMRNYVDTFDQRVTSRTDELSGTLDARLSQFEEQLGSRVTDLTTQP